MNKESQGSVIDFPSSNISVKAPIWNYFKVFESDKSKVSCNHCSLTLSLCPDKPILKRHLKRKHKKEFLKYRKEWLSLEDLPDEIILKILNFVTIKGLFQCLRVNKKIRTIANDQSLWNTMHLTDEMPAELLPKILAKGCQHLSLYNADIYYGSAKFTKNSHLKYLAVDSLLTHENGGDIFPDLASSCHGLEKLSVSVYPWDFARASKIFKCIIQNSQALRVLHIFDRHHGQLTMSLESVKLIVTLCVELTELNIGNTKLCQESINFICENLTPKIEKLDISWHDTFGDKQLKTLLARCNKLTEFAFAATRVSNKSVGTIIEILSPTLIKLEASTQHINLSGLLELASMPKIQLLNHELLSKEDGMKFEEIMPHLCVCDDNDYFQIAHPYHCMFYPSKSFWEIKTNLRTYMGVTYLRIR